MAAPMCTVEVVQEANAIEPVIVQFCNGRLRPEATGKISFQLLQNKKRKEKLLVADTKGMAYKGTSIDGPDQACKHFILLVDRARRKAKIMPTELFVMNPVLKDCESSVLSEKNTHDNDKENKQSKADELTVAFGSKKKKRAMESRIRHQVAKEELSSLMQKTATQLDESASSTFEEPKPSTSVADLLPSVNRDATLLDEVYDIDENSLSDAAAKVIEDVETDLDSWKSEKRYPQYILHHLEFLPVQEPARTIRATQLLFMHYLIYTVNLKSAQARLKDPFPKETPEPVKTWLLDMFFQTAAQRRRLLPTHLKDKLAGHILVGGLLLDKFQLNMTNLQSDVKIPQTKLYVLVRALGAKLETVDNVVFVKLKLPISSFSDNPRTMKRKRK